jgi:hypothetical protein
MVEKNLSRKSVCCSRKENLVEKLVTELRSRNKYLTGARMLENRKKAAICTLRF